MISDFDHGQLLREREIREGGELKEHERRGKRREGRGEERNDMYGYPLQEKEV